MKRLIALCCLAASSFLSLHADPLLYIMNQSISNVGFGSPPYVYQVDAATGVITKSWNTLTALYGEGVAVIGSTLYYTAIHSDPNTFDTNVYSYNLVNNIDNGIAFTVIDNSVAYPSAQSLSSIAFDGADFWIGDYYHTLGPGDTSNRNIYEVSPNGTVLKTIQLANCPNNCQLEFFKRDGVGYLISNRGNGTGPYDIYSLDGTLLTSDFIDGSQYGNTGVAYDGKYFYTADPYFQDVLQWDGATGAYMKVISVHSGAFPVFELRNSTFEDISVDYLTVNPSTATPEPSSFILLGSGLLAMAGAVRHRMRAGHRR